MKRYVKMVFAALLIILAGMAAFVYISSDLNAHKDDDLREGIVTLNEICRIAQEHRMDLSILDDAGYDMDFVILDLTDHVLYSNVEQDATGEKLTLENAIQRRYLYQYLKDDSRVWGCVILKDDGFGGFRSMRRHLFIGVGICVTLIILAMVWFGGYVNKNIIVPFDKMKVFAGHIAEGRLDTPLEMDRDNIFGAFSESFDIMREELRAAKNRELELQKKERELVASLSHDLKTPVTGIKAGAELLKMRLSKKEGIGEEIYFSRDDINKMSEDADGIIKKGDQIDALISDLFTTTLDDLGEFRVSLNDEDSRVLSDIVKSCDDRHLVVIGDIPPLLIHIDKKRMTQVIGNIISNSYKYAGTEINIDFVLSGGFLEMRIADQGPGVEHDEIELITNKFYRGRRWADSNTDGNGLGLYIAKTLMEKMNGTLSVSAGEGFAVTLVIPLS